VTFEGWVDRHELRDHDQVGGEAAGAGAGAPGDGTDDNKAFETR
jgi:hypothetical protein